VSLPVAEFFLCGLSISILKIYISFVCTKLWGVARSGQSTFEMFQTEASWSQPCLSAAKTFWHVHVHERNYVAKCEGES